MEPTSLAQAMGQIQKGPMLFAGLPSAEELKPIEDHKKQGGQIIYFVSEAEKLLYDLKPQEAGVVWTNDESVKQFLFENINGWMGGKIGNQMEGGIGAANENMPRAQRLASILMDVVQLWQFDQTSAKHLFKDNLPFKNMLKNHRWVDDGIHFHDLKGKGKGITTILIAAGPSLDSQWEHLKRIREKVPNVGFVVCGRSYKQAMKYGIYPEFIQEVEQFEWDDRLFLFAPEPPPNSIFVAPLTACPNLFHAWPNKGLVSVTWDHNYAQTMGVSPQEIAACEKSMDGGNSILHHMFHFASWLGSDTICLAGVDFAYPEGHKESHAQGTFHQWAPNVWKQEHQYQVPMKVPCTAGGEVTGSQPYRNFATYLEIAVNKAKQRQPNLKVINFSPKGQKIEGTQYEDISTWGTSPSPSSAPPLSPLASGPVQFSASWESASTLTSIEPSGSNSPKSGDLPINPASSEASS